MTDAPYFIFAFADPVGNLAFIKDEQEKLDSLLAYDRASGVLGFHHIHKATIDCIISDFDKYKSLKPCFFHFSGHADQIGIKLDDGHTESAAALSAVLKNNGVKILFLNACSTSTLVKEILDTTDVEAIIATRAPVFDKSARDISCAFYHDFVIKKKTLQEAYWLLFGRYENTCVTPKEAPQMIVGEMDDDIITLDKKEGFAWGLYAKTTHILNVRVSDIHRPSHLLLQKLDEEILKEEKELNKQRKILKLAADDEELSEGIKEKIAELEAALDQKIILRKKIVLDGDAHHESADAQEDQSLLETALKNLNYYNQRGVLRLENKPLGGMVMSGDKEGVLKLLYYHLLYEHKITGSNVLTFIFEPQSYIYDEFWVTLVSWLNMENINTADIQDAEKKKIIRYLIKDKFCGGDSDSHQHIVFRIVCTNKDLSKLEAILDELWQIFDFCITDLKLKEKMRQWKHKILFALIDETETVASNRFNIFEDAVLRLTSKGRFTDCFKVLRPVGCMTEEEIKNWFQLQPRLNRIGLKAELAPEIFQKSKGMVRQVLRELTGKANIKVPFIEDLI